MQAHKHVCTNARTHSNTHAHAHTHTHARARTHTHTHRHTHTHTHTLTHTHTHTHTNTNTHTLSLSLSLCSDRSAMGHAVSMCTSSKYRKKSPSEVRREAHRAQTFYENTRKRNTELSVQQQNTETHQGPYAPQGSRKLRKWSRRSKSVLPTILDPMKLPTSAHVLTVDRRSKF